MQYQTWPSEFLTGEQKTNIKKIIMAGLVAAAAMLQAAETPTVSNVKARQRYPWNGMVDIDYTLSGDIGGDRTLIFR